MISKKSILVLLICTTSYSNATEQLLFSHINTATESKIHQSSLYLKANFLQHSGKYHESLKTYNDLFSIDAPSHIYDGYLRLLSETNQFEKIASLIDKTQDLFEEDLDIQLIYAQSLLNTNQDEQAGKLLNKLKEKYPNNEQIVYYSAAQHEKTNNIKKALEVIDNFLTKTPKQSKLFLFYFLKAKIHLKINQHQEALKAINNSLKLFPRFDKGILFKALLLEQIGNIPEAIKMYKNFLDISEENVAIRKQLVQLLYSQKQFKQAAEELKKIKSNQPSYYFDLSLLEFKGNLHQKALFHINKALKQNNASIKAKMLKIDILLQLKKIKEALNCLQKWIIQTPHDNSLIKTLLILAHKGALIDDLIATLQEAHKKHKKQYNILLALGDLQLSKKEYEKARENYKKALSTTKNDELKAKIRFQIGFTYFIQNKLKKSESIVKQALKQKYIYASTYNLAATLYAQSNEKLQTALELINQALNHNAESAPFLHTKGVILYKLNDLSHAIDTLEQAHNIAPRNQKILKDLTNAKEKRLQQSTK